MALNIFSAEYKRLSAAADVLNAFCSDCRYVVGDWLINKADRTKVTTIIRVPNGRSGEIRRAGDNETDNMIISGNMEDFFTALYAMESKME